MWTCFVALNLGTLLAALHDPLAPLIDTENLRWLPPLAAALILLAVVAFLAHAWRRVLPLPTVALENSSHDKTG